MEEKSREGISFVCLPVQAMRSMPSSRTATGILCVKGSLCYSWNWNLPTTALRTGCFRLCVVVTI